MQVTACHLAADNGNADGLDKLWEWSKEKSVREEITRTMLCKELCDRRMAQCSYCGQDKLVEEDVGVL
jgi:hypothetical protein